MAATGSRGERLWIGGLAVVSAASVVLAITSLVLTMRLIGQPFPGFLVETNLNVSALSSPEWGGNRAGLVPFDRVLSANGRALSSAPDLTRLVAETPVGSPVTYQVLHGGRPKSVTVATQRFGWDDYVRSGMLFTVLIGLMYLAVGIATFWLNPRNLAAQAHLLFTVFTGMVFASGLMMTLLHQFTRFHLFQCFLMGGGFLHLAAMFPSPPRFLVKRPYLSYVCYAPAAAMCLLIAVTYRPAGHTLDPAAVDRYIAFVNLYSVLGVLSILVLLVGCMTAAWKGRSALARSQAKIVLLGAVASFVPFSLAFLLPEALGSHSVRSTLMVFIEVSSLIFFPLSIAWAIVRHQAFDIQFVIRKAALYSLTTAALGALYAVLSAVGYVLLGLAYPGWSEASVAGFIPALAVALAFRPLHEAIRRRVDRLFLGERADALETLAMFSQEPASSPSTYALKLVELLERALGPRWIRLEAHGEMLATAGNLDRAPGDTEAMSLSLPLLASGERQGMLQIGPRRNEMPYNAEERAMLRVLAAQAGVALQNAKLTEERVRLMVQEGVAKALAEERELVFRQVVQDLRSDLSSITLAVDVAQQELGDDSSLGSIQRSVVRIDELLNEKTRWIQEGRQSVSCSLRVAINRAVAAGRSFIQQKQQLLDVSLPPRDVELPLSTVEATQVIVNLLTNASKFSPVGSLIRCAVSLDGEDLVVSVEDEGPGIPPELMDDLASGRRADPSIPGSGLGLQNVQALLQSVGGRLGWRNSAQGAVVQAVFPVARLTTEVADALGSDEAG